MALRRGSAPMWLNSLLLAIVPLLVFGFYSVVDGAVERGAARRAAPPAARAQALPMQSVVWECDTLPGAGVHNACRPVPAGAFRGNAVRVSTAGS